jgi:hypothetical protein
MKKISTLILTILFLTNCTQKKSGHSIADSSTYNAPHLYEEVDTIAIPTKEQIKIWQNRYPIFNNKSFSTDYLQDIIHNPDGSIKMDYQEEKSRGSVKLKVRQFIGNSVPFTGKVFGDIKSLIVNGKIITVDDSINLFFRLNIDIQLGYNRIPVILINNQGKKLKAFIQFNYPIVDENN